MPIWSRRARSRDTVVLGSADDERGAGPVTGIADVDVAADRVRDQAVPASPNGGGSCVGCVTDVARRRRREQERRAGRRCRSAATARGRERGTAWRCQPWGATFRGRSRPAAAACGRSAEDVISSSRESAPGSQVGRGWRAGGARSAHRRSCDLPSRTATGAVSGSVRRGDAHRAERVMQPGLGRADRDAQGRRHLGQRHPQEVVQDDDRAMPGSRPRSARSTSSRSASAPDDVGRAGHRSE